MTLTDILTTYGFSMAEVNRRYGIPVRSMEDWKAGRRNAPAYLMPLLEKAIQFDKIQEDLKNDC